MHGRRSGADLVSNRAIDRVLEQFVGFALGAADRAFLLEFFLGFEHIALFGMPHAEIRPSQRVVGIGGERSLVPEFGVVVAAELAASIANEIGHVGIVVLVERAQSGDPAFVIEFVVNKGVGSFIASLQLFERAALVVRRLFLDVRFFGVGRRCLLA